MLPYAEHNENTNSLIIHLTQDHPVSQQHSTSTSVSMLTGSVVKLSVYRVPWDKPNIPQMKTAK